MRKTAALFLVSITFAGFGAGPPAVTPSAWQTLIDQLGDEEYDTRKAAGKKLADMGEDILPALRRAGKSHSDADVRLRAAVLASDIERRLDREVRVFRGHAQGVFAFALSPDGKRMASGAWQGATENVGRVWDVGTGKELFQLVGHTACVGGVAWEGKDVFTGGNDGRLMRWDGGTGKLLKEYTGNGSAIQSVAVNSRMAVTCGFEREARVWELEKAVQLGANADGPGVYKKVAMIPGGNRFAAVATDGSVRVIDLVTFELVRKMNTSHAGGALVVVAADDRVASGGVDGVVRLHDAVTGKLVREFKGHVGEVHAVAFSPDGKRLISGGADKVAVVWDIETGKAIQKLEGHTDLITCAAFLPGGRGAVTSSYDKTLRLWYVRR
jgi:WD40 repeat protein